MAGVPCPQGAEGRLGAESRPLRASIPAQIRGPGEEVWGAKLLTLQPRSPM